MPKTLKRAATKATNPLKPITEPPSLAAELQSLQRKRAIVLKSRNMQSNRLQALVAGTLGYSSGMAEKDRRKKFAEAAALIKQVAAGKGDTDLREVINVTLVGINAFEDMKGSLERQMLARAKQLPDRKSVV